MLKLIKVFDGALSSMCCIMMSSIGEPPKTCSLSAWDQIEQEWLWEKSIKAFVVRINWPRRWSGYYVEPVFIGLLWWPIAFVIGLLWIQILCQHNPYSPPSSEKKTKCMYLYPYISVCIGSVHPWVCAMSTFNTGNVYFGLRKTIVSLFSLNLVEMPQSPFYPSTYNRT